MCQQKHSDGASLREEKACPDCLITKNRPEVGLQRGIELSTMSNRCTSLPMVKKNQPQMYQDLVDFFDDPEAEQQEWQYSKSVQKRAWAARTARNLERYADECMV